ncbi:MAG: lipopolysaccharide assembly protein LapB [Gammaproteobacteria bacterium]|nr:lipopolysaccharide assembly protein LapB [Gammaproteobacteria bacterium]
MISVWWLLLLPLAAASSWWLARRVIPRDSALQRYDLARDYIRGINYFLNEQPDKAIDVFVRALDADTTVIEPHFALGSLFRRRGEVDRSIRIHQNLLARPSLTGEQRNLALQELAQDYMQSGLLDRAEGLFNELLERDPRNVQALRFLHSIYEQEKEWEAAIAVLKKIEGVNGEGQGQVIAHYYCEQAVLQLPAGDLIWARRLLRRALRHDRHCLRARLLGVQLAELSGRERAAVRGYRRAALQSPQQLSEIIAPWLAFHQQRGRRVEADDPMIRLLMAQPAVKPVLDYIEYRIGVDGLTHGLTELRQYLLQHPSPYGMLRYLQWSAGQSMLSDEQQFVRLQLSAVVEKTFLYVCSECGLSSNMMRWQCPGCRRWNTVRLNPESRRQEMRS